MTHWTDKFIYCPVLSVKKRIFRIYNHIWLSTENPTDKTKLSYFHIHDHGSQKTLIPTRPYLAQRSDWFEDRRDIEEPTAKDWTEVRNRESDNGVRFHDK